jgi:endonuclease/exonuclease/phosphatase family metal-dependent hydrolase
LFALSLGLGAAVSGCSGGSSGGSKSSSSTAAGSTAGVTSGTTGTTPPPPATTPINSGSFSLLTYNVAGLPQGISQSNPIANTPQISPLLNRYDLVLVQEDFSYHHLLEPQTTHPYESAPLTTFSTLVNDGLNRFSWSPFTSHTRQKWSVCNGWWNASNDCLSSKGFTVARHELSPGIEVDVYNLHADAGGGADDQAARASNMAQVAAYIASFSAGNAVIVAGDTNLRESRPGDAPILADFMGTTGLQDVSKLLNKPDHIDRVFFMDGLDVILTPTQWRVADEFKDANGNPLSDHPAIHVDFDYRKR